MATAKDGHREWCYISTGEILNFLAGLFWGAVFFETSR
jgi:hypothetical protein